MTEDDKTKGVPELLINSAPYLFCWIVVLWIPTNMYIQSSRAIDPYRVENMHVEMNRKEGSLRKRLKSARSDNDAITCRNELMLFLQARGRYQELAELVDQQEKHLKKLRGAIGWTPDRMLFYYESVADCRRAMRDFAAANRVYKLLDEDFTAMATDLTAVSRARLLNNEGVNQYLLSQTVEATNSDAMKERISHIASATILFTKSIELVKASSESGAPRLAGVASMNLDVAREELVFARLKLQEFDSCERSS